MRNGTYLSLLCCFYSIIVMAPVTAQEVQIKSREQVRREFDELYQQYVKAPLPPPRSASSYSPQAEAILEKMAVLGPRVAPLLIAKYRETGDISLGMPLYLVTRKDFPKEDWPQGQVGDSRGIMEMYLKWWDEDLTKTPDRFEDLYTKWCKVRGDGEPVAIRIRKTVLDRDTMRISEVIETTEAGTIWVSMQSLGVAALPFMVAKLKGGDTDMLTLIALISGGQSETQGDAKPEERKRHCLLWWENNSPFWTIADLEKKEERGK